MSARIDGDGYLLKTFNGLIHVYTGSPALIDFYRSMRTPPTTSEETKNDPVAKYEKRIFGNTSKH